MTPATFRKALKKQYREARPSLLRALAADVVAFCANRGERIPVSKLGRWRTAVRLVWQADDFLGVVLYRLRMALYDAGIPILPKLLHFLCIQIWSLRIGDFVMIEEGVYIPHGQIVMDGIVNVGRGAVLCPWITLGLVQGGIVGPTLAEGVFVGTGAKLLGDVKIGANANIGANAVVLKDVPAGATAAGVPARIVTDGPASSAADPMER